MKSPKLLVLTTCADGSSARQLARSLVEARLAACVNVLEGVASIYRWKGEIEQAAEVLLLVKTTADRYEALESAIRETSGYELPEVLAITIERGLPQYLRWIDASIEP